VPVRVRAGRRRLSRPRLSVRRPRDRARPGRRRIRRGLRAGAGAVGRTPAGARRGVRALRSIPGPIALVGGIVLVVVVALLVTGRGESDPQKVRATLDAYREATSAKDYQRICDDLYAKELVEGLSQAGLACELALRTGFKDVRRPTLTVRSVEISGDQALAQVRTDAANEEPADVTVRLVEQDGDWRVASLSQPQPQPPAQLEP
jgi:hypothetical protein